MGSTYTDNGGIEKIGLGEQAGAWGTTTNNNFVRHNTYFDNK